ncbi:tripartite tricarboxylate transporter substrate binding protein [Sphaerotilus uruguayifluvii]|uniref:Tripartite-type tricarboxylate transporter receptor subunit TctC n=1 Tax=Sphaerotilus uruguayifluvii TaxID=2735897 RepID=A0ABX2G7P3_9BURK|nr:tripartite tricarboxylate transporter substrate binding protein [Leptothrix sp. C29]NRT57232.1 tripartite-type tricarboxylate transporter receptor subunit TctC [Leptothrix sp. C29]
MAMKDRAQAGATSPERRRLLGAIAAAVAAGPAGVLAARAQPGGAASGSSDTRFPVRPITLWVPWPAGGATDLTMRLLADLAGRQLGQKVIVENRSGAGGTLAMPILQQAAPDGYTIAQLPHPALRAPHIQKVLWDPIRDTTPIIQISGVTFGLLVPAGSPLRSFEDVVAFAKARPGELTVSTNGVGTTPHVVMEELAARRGFSYVHVPYKGTSEQMLAVASGQVTMGINSNGFAPFVDSGRLRLLATLAEHRNRRWPNVPTLKELGQGVVATSPYGLVGPHGLPPAVVATLHEAFRTAMHAPAHVAELAKYDQELDYLNPEDYGRSLRESYAAEKRAAERMGLGRGG